MSPSPRFTRSKKKELSLSQLEALLSSEETVDAILRNKATDFEPALVQGMRRLVRHLDFDDDDDDDDDHGKIPAESTRQRGAAADGTGSKGAKALQSKPSARQDTASSPQRASSSSTATRRKATTASAASTGPMEQRTATTATNAYSTPSPSRSPADAQPKTPIRRAPFQSPGAGSSSSASSSKLRAALASTRIPIESSAVRGKLSRPTQSQQGSKHKRGRSEGVNTAPNDRQGEPQAFAQPSAPEAKKSKMVESRVGSSAVGGSASSGLMPNVPSGQRVPCIEIGSDEESSDDDEEDNDEEDKEDAAQHRANGLGFAGNEPAVTGPFVDSTFSPSPLAHVPRPPRIDVATGLSAQSAPLGLARTHFDLSHGTAAGAFRLQHSRPPSVPPPPGRTFHQYEPQMLVQAPMYPQSRAPGGPSQAPVAQAPARPLRAPTFPSSEPLVAPQLPYATGPVSVSNGRTQQQGPAYPRAAATQWQPTTGNIFNHQVRFGIPSYVLDFDQPPASFNGWQPGHPARSINTGRGWASDNQGQHIQFRSTTDSASHPDHAVFQPVDDSQSPLARRDFSTGSWSTIERLTRVSLPPIIVEHIYEFGSDPRAFLFDTVYSFDPAQNTLRDDRYWGRHLSRLYNVSKQQEATGTHVHIRWLFLMLGWHTILSALTEKRGVSKKVRDDIIAVMKHDVPGRDRDDEEREGDDGDDDGDGDEQTQILVNAGPSTKPSDGRRRQQQHQQQQHHRRGQSQAPANSDQKPRPAIALPSLEELRTFFRCGKRLHMLTSLFTPTVLFFLSNHLTPAFLRSKCTQSGPALEHAKAHLAVLFRNLEAEVAEGRAEPWSRPGFKDSLLKLAARLERETVGPFRTLVSRASRKGELEEQEKGQEEDDNDHDFEETSDDGQPGRYGYLEDTDAEEEEGDVVVGEGKGSKDWTLEESMSEVDDSEEYMNRGDRRTQGRRGEGRLYYTGNPPGKA